MSTALAEKATVTALWTLKKWHDEGRFLAGYEPDEILDLGENLLLNEGITRMLQLLIGGGGTVYSNANARIGVGNGTTAAAAAQTALQGASTAFKAMDASFPAVSGQTVTFQSTFAAADGNFAWEEATVDNGAAANENLNRKVQAMGTKVSPAAWQISVAITIA